MDKPSVLIVVVLYKCNLEESQTWASLIACPDYWHEKTRVLVFDNSPNELSKAEQTLISSIGNSSDYFHSPENISLAKIYNSAIQKRESEDFLLLLDQDSEFDSRFFTEFYLKANLHSDIDLFLPYVVHNQIVVSPGNWLGYKGRYWKNLKTGIVDSKNLTAIASGMVVRFTYLANDPMPFDETFLLYGIDTYFMQKFSKNRPFAYVLNYELKHDLSIYSETSEETRLFRFRNFFSSTLLLTKESAIKRTKALIYLFYKSLEQSIKNRDIRYFTTWFE